MKKFLTTEEAAQKLGHKKGTLDQWRFQGRGPKFIKIGRSVRYTEDHIEEWMAGNTFTSTSEYVNS